MELRGDPLFRPGWPCLYRAGTMMLANADTDRVFQSCGRCCQHEAFFETFYQIFLDKSDEIRVMFEDTDMAEQRRLLSVVLSASWPVAYLALIPCVESARP